MFRTSGAHAGSCLLLALSAALGPLGCEQSPAPSTAPAAAKKPRVALVMKSLANEFFKTMQNGAEAHARQHAAEYELIADGIKDELAVAEQIDMVERMIARHVDALVIAPADSKALVAVCKKAQDGGVVVVNIDNKFDQAALAEKQTRIPFVGPDNRAGAKLAGDYLAKQLRPYDEVAIIDGAPNAFNAMQRKLGFEDALRENSLRIVAAQTGKWEMEEANKVVGALLPAQPALKAILCANDNMALGAVAALRAAGRLGAVKVVGFDNIAAVQEKIRHGEVVCTIDQHADQIAVFGIEYALEILKTGQTPKDRQTPVDLITKDTLSAAGRGTAGGPAGPAGSQPTSAPGPRPASAP